MRRRVPYQKGPTADATQHIFLDLTDDPLRDIYSELGETFEEELQNVTSKCINLSSEIPDYSHITKDRLEIMFAEGEYLVQDYPTLNTYSVLVGMSSDELEEWKKAYTTDKLYSKILKASQIDNDEEENYPQYQIRDAFRILE